MGQDQDQDRMFQDQDQDHQKTASSGLETKTAVTRTTPLPIDQTICNQTHFVSRGPLWGLSKFPPVGSGASENRLTAPIAGLRRRCQNRTRAHQRLKTGDLRRPPYLLFGSFMVVVLAYSQFPYRTKEQNTIPEEGPPVWSGK